MVYTKIDQELTGRLRWGAVKIAFDSSTYVAGGVKIDLARVVGIKNVHMALIEPKAGFVFSYDRVNKKILAYRQKDPASAGGSDIPLTEVNNGTDLSSLTDVRMVIWGV